MKQVAFQKANKNLHGNIWLAVMFGLTNGTPCTPYNVSKYNFFDEPQVGKYQEPERL